MITRLRSAQREEAEAAMAADRLTVLLMPESAYGPTNNCVGIGDMLRRRGHRVVFAAEASWQGKLAPLGFTEDLVSLAPPAQGEQEAGQFWKDFIAETAPEFRKPTIEQLGTWVKPVWAELISGARYCHDQLGEIIDRVAPDVIVEDNVVAFPALVTAGAPFVRIVSCNPLELPDPGLPPAFSGYPAGTPDGRAEFRAEYDRVHRELWAEFSAWVTEQGAPPLPDLEFVHSGALNLYLYPEVADYRRGRPLGESWHRLDSCVRQTDEKFEIPAELADRAGSLIYFSLGSLGSADVGLMRKVIGALADTPHRYIVSKGPLHAEIELPPNMWGAEFVPQASVIPLADLVITHGGNNTTTECLHFGKPMVVLPLFWDQYDNAQRVHELGLGVRLDTHGCTDAELRAAVDGLLHDQALPARLAAASATIQSRQGLRHAADLIEAATGAPPGAR
ncbi:MAG TPA: nucleotide disphospho-sugar-binding domain-containing protein [Streptosporangiaceae bacterium]